jgi:hypothetical protein
MRRKNASNAEQEEQFHDSDRETRVPGVTDEEIARHAYTLWEKNGRLLGTELENWLEAERELRMDPNKADRAA